MKLKLFFTLTACAAFFGCYATKEDIKEMYERQTALETQIARLSYEIQELKELDKKRELQITNIEKSVKENHLYLNSKLSDLEKQKSSLDSSVASSIPSNPKESADALYSRAESYYKEGKFKDAVLEFQRFIDTYSRDDRVPASYLKQGLSLINMGRKEGAKFFLSALIDKFPKSEEAGIARKKLKEI